MKHPILAFALILTVGSFALEARAANDAGASTFEAAERLYRAKPFRVEDLKIPEVAEMTEEAAAPVEKAAEKGMRFPIDSFDVAGNTLLSADRIEAALGKFRGQDKTIDDVQLARDALQAAYDEEGLLTVAVTIPPQTVDRGSVRLEVVEARVGQVVVENDGVDWFSEKLVRKDVPHVQPNVILRRDELQADLTQANWNPDRRVRPTLSAGSEENTVDVKLLVDDQIPLHGSMTLTNNYSPGSPKERILTDLRYGNLWGIEHELGVAYQFSPTDRFDDLQIFSATYRAPMPWDSDQSLFYYIVYSDSQNGIVNAADLSALGRGFNMGLRYRFELGSIDWLGGLSHAFTLAVDRKDVENSVQAPGAEITTPIEYLPFGFEYSLAYPGENSFVAAQIGLSLNHAGTLSGGTPNDFQANRVAKGVTGDYRILNLGLQYGLRLSSLLETLVAQRPISLSKPEIALTEDWAFFLRSRGQYASEPLISTEQFAAGGLDSVRGYLQSEQFGDDGWSGQFELRTRSLRRFLGGRLAESVQAIAFYDAAKLHVRHAGDGAIPSSWTTLQSYGLGLRARLLDHLTAEFYVARPVESTTTTDRDLKYQFQIGAGF